MTLYLCPQIKNSPKNFLKNMSDEFNMNMMHQINFFLGLGIKRKSKGIFINLSKYAKEVIKKFGLKDAKIVVTSMVSTLKLDKM